MRVTPAIRALASWLVIGVVLAAALLAAQAQRSGLDDPDPGRQRQDALDTVGPRSEAPLVTSSIPVNGKVTVVFFVRSAQQLPLIAALSKPRTLPARVEAAVVGGPANLSSTSVASVTDMEGALARGYRMPVPRDHGYPVGYAIVGRDGTIRYRTLDPGVATRLDEVRTMLRAVP